MSQYQGTVNMMYRLMDIVHIVSFTASFAVEWWHICSVWRVQWCVHCDLCLPIQVDPAKYRNMFYALRLTAAEEGIRGLARGWAPTLIGYSMQGLCKFGFYEVFKSLYSNILGEVSLAYS